MAKSENGAPLATLNDKIEETLLQSRRLFLCDDINDEVAADIIRKLWFLEISDPGKPILMIINSPGGSIDAGFAIWDQAKMISSPVTTLITGLAASMASILSLCADPGRRYATPYTRVMIHQPLIGGLVKGQATDLAIQAKEIIKTRSTLVKIYVEATGKKPDEIEKAIDRDTWMTAAEAKEFGLLSKIVSNFDELEM